MNDSMVSIKTACGVIRVVSCAIALFLLFPALSAAQSSLRINELMASNKSTVADEDGDYSDWIEIYNSSDSAVSLFGWSLTNNPQKPRQWSFPDRVIGAHEYLIVWASNKKRAEAGSPLHTNFKLSADGEYLALVAPYEGGSMELESFPALSSDNSWGICRYENGIASWAFFEDATPGRYNGESAKVKYPAPSLSVAHGFYEEPFTVQMTAVTPQTTIYYTTDGSKPTRDNGIGYVEPLTITTTTVLRAVALPIDKSDDIEGAVATATYLFIDDVLRQGNTPDGYPSTWGDYHSISGTSVADYEMDPEVLAYDGMAEKVKNGLCSLPIVSLVTDKGYFFSHEQNEEKGGIYIYTGGTDGSAAILGDGWRRAVSLEIFSSDPNEESIQIDCAVKMHGNASRLPEKTPKHSLRLQFKREYGPGKLNFPLFRDERHQDMDEFNQIVLRAGFGNSWLHWLTGQQRAAMYTRDTWAKRMMDRMGYLAPRVTYAHLFINGLYWGMYNPTERIDDDFCSLRLGGEREDYDVIRMNEDAGLQAQYGNMTAYNSLLTSVNNSNDYVFYQKMQGLNRDGTPNENYKVLFDKVNFIDYMILNQYGGNGDWDHHNWVSVRNRNGNEGFKWLPWDSELVLQGINDSNLDKNNSKCPTYIFNTLMEKSPHFRMDFIDRVYRQCVEPFGSFAPDSALAVWQELTDVIDDALYAESARWGDYRRDVHPYTSRGSLYLKEMQYEAQKQFMVESYFPQRTEVYLRQLKDAGFWAKLDAPQIFINGELMTGYCDSVSTDDVIRISGKYTVCYALDGADPLAWTVNGYAKRNSAAQVYEKSFTLTDDCTLRARSYLNSSGWSPLTERRLLVRKNIESEISPAIAQTEPKVVYCNGNIALQFETASCEAEVQVYDMGGRRLRSLNQTVGAGSCSIAMEDMPDGVYIVQLSLTTEKGTERFVLKCVK